MIRNNTIKNGPRTLINTSPKEMYGWQVFIWKDVPHHVIAASKSLQLCPTLCNPRRQQPTWLRCPRDSPGKNTGMGCISFSNAWKQKLKVKSLSRVRLLVTPWTAAHQAPPSMGFSRQEYWSGVPLPSPIMSLGECKLKWATTTHLLEFPKLRILTSKLARMWSNTNSHLSVVGMQNGIVIFGRQSGTFL